MTAEERARSRQLAKQESSAQQGKPASKAPERIEEPPEPAPPSLSGNFMKLRGRCPCRIRHS